MGPIHDKGVMTKEESRVLHELLMEKERQAKELVYEQLMTEKQKDFKLTEPKRRNLTNMTPKKKKRKKR